VATLLLKIGKRELQKCTFNRKEALFTPSDTATGYLSCADDILVKRILIPQVSYSERHHAPSAKQRKWLLDIFRRLAQMPGTKSCGQN
jgi:hypothetical protein